MIRSPWPSKRQLPLLLLLPFLVTGCGEADADMAGTTGQALELAAVVPQATEVRVEVVTLQPSTATLDIVVPAEVEGSRDALLASPMGGFVERVFVDEGDTVRRGASLVAIDRSTATARRDQAAAQLEQAQSDLGRVETLGDAASAQLLTQTTTQLKLAQAGYDLAQISFTRSMISAPFEGVVAQLSAEVGEVAGPGAPLARLVQLDPVSVSMSVSDRDVISLREGMAVAVQTGASSTIFQGTLDAISPAADLKTRSFVVKATVPNPDHLLLPGMVARVTLADTVADQTVVIPQEWLVTRIDSVGIFVVEDGMARWRAVTAGRIVHDQVVIDQGLSVGETIVSTGQRALADGDTLLIARDGTCCSNGRATF